MPDTTTPNYQYKKMDDDQQAYNELVTEHNENLGKLDAKLKALETQGNTNASNVSLLSTALPSLRRLASTRGTVISATLTDSTGVYLAIVGGQSNEVTSGLYLITKRSSVITTREISGSSYHTITVDGDTWTLTSQYGIIAVIWQFG